ncbi:hypothetical protein DY000_02010334 [Brassica cretica]|uniref:TPX2 C-terminal domain-containing protein n=1 Tax=Brassica cretica TaxID=69181 RepID=A0ABQ7BZ80_BRACR|nr:hypothetical protein DY000_02010334 [Brassica cretica]
MPHQSFHWIPFKDERKALHLEEQRKRFVSYSKQSSAPPFASLAPADTSASPVFVTS